MILPRSPTVRLWLAMVAAPVALNLFLWLVLANPLQRRLATLRSTRAATEMGPTLEQLLKESREILLERRKAGLPEAGFSAIVPWLQQSAEAYRLQIDVQMKGSSGAAAAAVEVVATGNFHKLGRWLGDLEKKPDFRVDSWSWTAGSEPGQSHRLTIHMTAFLKGSR